MKKPLIKLLISAFCIFLATTFKAQSPCQGTPASNTVLPMGTHTVCAGSSASMSLLYTYTNTGLTYQWYFSTVSSVGPFTTLSGATSTSYVSVPLYATTYFLVIITCTVDNSSVSVYHTVYVVSCANPCTGVPASNTIMPVTQTICAGSTAAMSLATTYTETGITYQWGSSTTQSGPYSPISGATTSSYTSPPLNSTGNRYYNVIITCTNSSQSYSLSHQVSVVSCTYCSGTPGSNTIMPFTQTVCAGTAATMSLANSYTASGITYQWQMSTVSSTGPFTSISGATNTAYTTPNLTVNTYYQVVITCTNSGLSYSTTHLVTVLPCNSPCTGAPASTSILPVSHSVCMGDAALLTLSSTYTDSGITYQWGLSGAQAGPYAPIAGATLSAYSSPPLTSSAYYNVVITCTNSGLSYTTTHYVSVVSCTYCNSAPGDNTVVPEPHSICSGYAAFLSLANTYTYSGINYQWESSQVSITGPFTPIAGATQSTFSTGGLVTDAYFQVVITCTNSGQSIKRTHKVSVVICDQLEDPNAEPDIRVSPVPVHNAFKVVVGIERSFELTVTDVTGRILLVMPGTGQVQVDAAAFAPGIYYLKVAGSFRTNTLRIIKLE
jgi:hypothetical protein